MKASTKKGLIYTIIALVVVVTIIVTAVVVSNNKRENTANAIMQLDTNPSVQLVLNQNDKVVSEVALNADGEKLLANVSFMGLKAEVAAQQFAKIASEMDKINDSTSAETPNKSTVVKITISAEDIKYYEELANKAKTAVNEFFKENGVFAGAVTEVTNDIKSAVSNMIANTKDYINLTTDQLLEYAKTTANDLKQIALENKDALQAQFNALYNTILKTADEALELARAELENVAEISQSAKQILQRAFNQAAAEYNRLKVELDKQYQQFVNTLQQQSKALLNQIKIEAENAYNQTVEIFNAHASEFKQLAEQLKNQRIAEIQDFQAQLTINA